MHPIELLFPIALACYTISIWSSHRKKALRRWMVWTFGAGLAADASGTIFLCAVSATAWRLTFHAVSGVFALVLMTLHFVWAILAFWTEGRSASYFHRFSIPTWGLWCLAFLSGAIAPHG